MYRKLRKYLFLIPVSFLVLVIMGLLWGNMKWNQHISGNLERGEAKKDRLALSMFDEERFIPDSSWSDTHPIRFQNNFSAETFQAPSAAYRPWIRWWWPGAWVDSLQLKKELNEFAQNGYGGVDIQPLAIGLDPEMKFWERVYQYNSENFYAYLHHLIPYAKNLGLDVDLSISSTSPSGGPHVGLAENVQSLAYAEATILGDKIISLDLPLPRIPYFNQWMGWEEMFLEEENDQWASFQSDKLELLEVFAAKTLEENRSQYAIYLDDYIKLDPDSILLITDYTQSGKLIWDAPPGYWKIIAVYKLPSGQSPWEFPARQKGFVLNPFDSSHVMANHNFLLGQRTGLPPFYGRGLRGLSQAPFTYQTERMFSSQILPFFKEKFNYDLTPFFPVIAIPGKDNHLLALQEAKRGPEYILTDLDAKIREDYDLCVSEYFIQNFLDTQEQWARDRGLVSRVHPFGIDIDIIKAAGHSDMAETSLRHSGYGRPFLKMFSSGTELYGRPWLSALCLDTQHATFSFSPGQMKDAADELFLSGVNHLVFQGVPYQKLDKAYGKESWHPFASTFFSLDYHSENLGKDNPYWKFLPQINTYVSRCQYLLRQGRSNANILIYYPFLGFPVKKGSEFPNLESIGLTSGEVPSAAWLKNTEKLLEALDQMGLDWIWVNDESLQKAKARGDKIEIGENSYDRLVLMDVPSIDIATARNIYQLGQDGAELLILDRFPQEVRGYYNYEEKMAELEKINQELPQPIELESLDDIQNYFSGFPIKEKIGFARPYQYLRSTYRTSPDFDMLFLKNTAEKDRFYELKISTEQTYNYLFNPWKGSIHLMEEGIEGVHRVFLKTQNSAFVLSAQEPIVPDSLLSEIDRLDASLLGELRLNARHVDRWDFIMTNESRTSSTVEYLDTTLFDWSQNEFLRYCSEEALYRSSFDMGDTLSSKQYILDLGEMDGAVELYINTEFVANCIVPPFRIDISKYLSPGFNTLEIWLIPPLKNRMIGKALEGDERYKHFENQQTEISSNGIKGPVLIWEVDKNSEIGK